MHAKGGGTEEATVRIPGEIWDTSLQFQIQKNLCDETIKSL